MDQKRGEVSPGTKHKCRMSVAQPIPWCISCVQWFPQAMQRGLLSVFVCKLFVCGPGVPDAAHGSAFFFFFDEEHIPCTMEGTAPRMDGVGVGHATQDDVTT